MMSYYYMFNGLTNGTSWQSMYGVTDETQKIYGFMALSVAILFFGSNYLPVKQFETGDGMFFQLMLTIGIWSVGFVVNSIRNFPTFYALPMLGGFFWSTGNLNTVPIIKLVGLGMGALMWNSVLLVVGWAIARFGLFGVTAEVPSNTTLNYVGVILAGLSGIFYLFVKTETHNVEDETRPLLQNIQVANDTEIVTNVTSDRLSPSVKRVLGLSMACFSGVLYAFTFTPALYVQCNYDHASQNALDYVFSMYTGILLSMLFYFVIYCLIKKNKPLVYPRVILPALVSGWMWACANSLFFFSNNSLTQAITFPIVSSGPSAVAALWGIFLYKEIKGTRNFVILSFGFMFAIAGSILCGISK